MLYLDQVVYADLLRVVWIVF